jgi:electron transfer flavoprotein alpha/beta subunit
MPGSVAQEALSMKILVAYKRVVDYNVRIQVKPDGSGVVTEGVKLSANPFDEIALEEALRLRDKGIATEVVVATIAPRMRRRTCATAWRWARTAPSTS